MNVNSSGVTSLERMESFVGERQRCLAWPSYHSFWKKNYSELKVRNPSEDICTFCFKFSNRHKFTFCASGSRTKEKRFGDEQSGDKRDGDGGGRSDNAGGGGIGDSDTGGELGHTGAMGKRITEGGVGEDEAERVEGAAADSAQEIRDSRIS